MEGTKCDMEWGFWNLIRSYKHIDSISLDHDFTDWVITDMDNFLNGNPHVA